MRAILSVATLLLTSTAVYANGLSPFQCATDTVADYQTNYGTGSDACSNGILNFSFFSFEIYQSSGGTALTASQIDLSPLSPGQGQTGATGFSVTGLDDSPISAAPGQSVTYVIDWLYNIDSGPVTSGASLGMDPPSGDITITQYYCLDSNFENGQSYEGVAPTCTTSLEGTRPGVQALTVSTTDPNDLCDDSGDYCASTTFNPPAQAYAEVMTVIQLTGGDDGATFDSVNGSAQIDPPAPEPATFLLIPAGMLLLICIRRRPIKL